MIGKVETVDQASHLTMPVTFTRLYPEERIIGATGFGEAGMTKRSFRALCQILGVPMLHVGNRRYIDGMTFSYALKVALMPGKKDLLTPGCYLLRTNDADELKHRRKIATEELFEDMESVLAHIVAGMQANQAHLSTPELREQYRGVISKILEGFKT